MDLAKYPKISDFGQFGVSGPGPGFDRFWLGFPLRWVIFTLFTGPGFDPYFAYIRWIPHIWGIWPNTPFWGI